MPVSYKDHGGVAVAVAVAPSGVHEALDFGFGQVLPRPQVAIGRALRGNRSFYGG